MVAIVWVARMTVRSEHFSFAQSSFDHLRVTGLALAVGVVALALACIVASRRGKVASVNAVLVVGLLAVLGSGRQAALPSAVTVAVTAAWLGVAAAGAAFVETASRPAPQSIPRAWSYLCAALVATALLAASADAGRGLGATLGRPSSATVSAPTRCFLSAHLAAWICVGVQAALRLRTSRRSAAGASRLLLGRGAIAVAAVWWLALAAQRAIHLLAVRHYRDVFRGVYSPWALIVGEYVPVAATGALIMAVGWNQVISPRVHRLPSSIVLIPGSDPVAVLRNNLSWWTGDPTLTLVFADHDGRWIHPADSSTTPLEYPRAATEIRREGHVIGQIEHDVALTRAPEVLRTAAELSGLGFDTNRFVAISEERLRRSQRLSERLLTADIDSRREVAQALFDGPIAQLRSAAEALRFGAAVDGVADQLRSATTNVRVLSHGVYPPELEDGGLAAVMSDRNGVPQRRLSPATEITAFLAAHDDNAAWFVDTGATLEVHRTRPLPAGSISDRINVLGGRIEERTLDGDGITSHVAIILHVDQESPGS